MDILITSPSLSSRTVTPITAQTDFNITHNLGVPPVVLFIDSNGSTEYLTVKHDVTNFNSFTYTSAIALTGWLVVM